MKNRHKLSIDWSVVQKDRNSGTPISELASKYGCHKSSIYLHTKSRRSKASEKAGTLNGSIGKKITKNTSGDSSYAETIIAFLFGRITEQINSYSQSAGIPEAVLTSRISELLHRKASGSRLGPFD